MRKLLTAILAVVGFSVCVFGLSSCFSLRGKIQYGEIEAGGEVVATGLKNNYSRKII